MGIDQRPRRRKSRFSIIRVLLVSLASAYILLLLFGCFVSDRLIFPVPHPSYQDAHPFFPILKLTSTDGAKISAVYLANPQARFTVLYNHGNGEDLGRLIDYFQEYQRHGFAVFSYDYHGYGTSGGKPTERNVCSDADAAYDYLTNQLRIPPGQILIHGKSLGGGVGIDLASRKPAGGLIAESTFVSAFRVSTHFPLVPFDKFRNLDKIGRVHYPVLVIHGNADPFIPPWHGRMLFALANQPKFSLWVDGAGHNDLGEVAGEAYWQAIRDFAKSIATHVPPL